MNKTIQSRKFRGGAYATAISFLVIVALVIVNLVAGSIFPYKDLTSTGKYSLADATKEYLKTVKTPIDLYYVLSEGEEELIIQQSAEQIAAECDNISLHYKDPIQYPQFVYEYNGMAEITNNSIIVINRDDPTRYEYIDSEQMKIYDIDMQNLVPVLNGYDAELEIVKAIVSVTQEAKGTVYMTEGHREWEWIQGGTDEQKGKVTETFLDLMSLNSFKVKYCDLTKQGAIPEDCDILFIGSPLSDFTAQEVALVEEYMTNGGTVFISLMISSNTFTNLQSLLGQYGLTFDGGIVCESDEAHTIGNINSSNSYILADHGKRSTVWPGAVPLRKASVQKKTTVLTTLSATTNGGYVRQLNEDTKPSSSDQKASYPLLVKAEDTFQGKTGTMYVFASTYFFSDAYLTGSASFDNRVLLIECMAGASQEAAALSIPDTTAMEEALQMSTNQKNNVALLSFLFPALILVVGIVIVLRRRIEKVTQ